MRLVSFNNRIPVQANLTTKRMLLRRPAIEDYSQWSSLRESSRDFLQPWEPKWAWNELSRGSFKARLRQQESDITSQRGQHWFLLDHRNNLLGGLSLSNIRRGIADTGTLGYWVGAPHAGHGYMKEAVTALCTHAFIALELHRLEAATLLDNTRSQKVLGGCGFQIEGVARSYLKINDQWRDHLLYSRIREEQT